MLNIGIFNDLTVIRRAEFGYYLDAKTGNTSDDVLLPNNSALGRELNIGDEVCAFIYRDSKDRIIATLKEPIAKVGDVAYLAVVSKTEIGSFIDIGLERDVFVPYREEGFKIEKGNKYLFYIYVDKTGRLAATTKVDGFLTEVQLDPDNLQYRVGDEVTGVVYGYQTNDTLMVAVDNLYRGIILKNEYYTDIKPGDVLTLRIKKFYEDNKMNLTTRNLAVVERNLLADTIVDYLKEHDGFMKYNDKSSPDEIKGVFHESKNYFKNALGSLMKRGIIKQDEKGTYLIKS